MADYYTSSIRLADLIWRTIKIRVSLLVLAIIALLVVWSALQTGNQRAQAVDVGFCRTLTNQYNEVSKSISTQFDKTRPGQPPLPYVVFSVDEQCNGPASRRWIEVIRLENDKFLLQMPLPVDATALLKRRPKEFTDYDAERLAAYRLRINLSSTYSGGSIEVNSLSVAEILPFCVLVALAAYFILGFQEKSYRKQLGIILKAQNLTGSDASLALAETQFFAPPPFSEKGILIRHLVETPEKLAAGTLLIATVILLIKIVSVYIFDLLHLTDTIFASYPFNLYFGVTIFALVLYFTRQAYFGSALTNRRWKITKPIQWHRIYKWVPEILVAMGLVSFSFPWATYFEEDTVRGYEFATRSEVLSQMRPLILNEIRFQVWLAAFFLLACALDAALRKSARRRIATRVRNARAAVAAAILFLGINFLIYLAILQYESMVATPWLDNVPTPGSNAPSSMLAYNPTCGFWIFLACTLILAILSVMDWRSQRREVADG